MATENSTPAAAPAEPAAVHQDASAASDTAAPAPPTDALPVKPSSTTATPVEQQPQQPTQDSGSNTQAQTSDPSSKPPASTSDSHATESTKQTSPEVDNSKPKDFDGEIATTSELPAPELIKKLDEYVVLDRHGKTHTFKSLHSGRNVARRMLVIFVRHFYCGVRPPETPSTCSLTDRPRTARTTSAPSASPSQRMPSSACP